MGDVERVDAAAALVEAADQHRVPGAAVEDVADRRRAVDVEPVRVVAAWSAREDSGTRRRDERQCFHAGGGVEGVQHAVVGAGVHHLGRARRSRSRTSNRARDFERIAITERRRADEDRRRRNDVAELASAGCGTVAAAGNS